MPFPILVVFGTRPEAIKLSALIRRLQSLPGEFRVRTAVTAQHRSMLDQVLRAFQITPDNDLDLMTAGQTPTAAMGRILGALEPVLALEKPGLLLVQGDTTTALAGALAAFYAQVPVAHVEAGLRTGNPSEPFPEEMNRLLITKLAELHFAPTARAAANLLGEGVSAANVEVTGNTVVDAVIHVRQALRQGHIRAAAWPFPKPGRKLILVTAHRRESFGADLERICLALAWLAKGRDVEIAFPVHCNPSVRQTVGCLLAEHPRIHLLEPLDYPSFIDLLSRSHLVLTDSGGIQEEAPTLGKPVLVLRRTTDRPETLQAGTARLVGSDPETIVAEASRLLDDAAHYQRMAERHDTFGDGRASERIVAALERYARQRRPRAKSMTAATAAQVAARLAS